MIKIEENNGQFKVELKDSNINTMLQLMVYTLDTAYKGNQLVVEQLAEQIPDIVKEYYRLKEQVA